MKTRPAPSFYFLAIGSLLLSLPLTEAEANSPKAVVAALRSGDNAAALALLETGTPVDQPTSRDGSTLLHLAAGAGAEGVVARLLELGASPAKRDRDGRSALHRIAESQNPTEGTLRQLLQTGLLLVDDQDHAGMTPLHIAVDRKNLPASTLLFASGADPGAAATNGTTPLDTARRRRNRPILELLGAAPAPQPPAPASPREHRGYPDIELGDAAFEPSALTLSPTQRDSLKRNLTTLGRNFQDSRLVTLDLRARALAAALGLDRRYRPAVVADAQLRRGISPTPVPTSSTPLHLASEIGKSVQSILAQNPTDDDRRLATLLADVARALDPLIALPPSDPPHGGSAPGSADTREQLTSSQPDSPAEPLAIRSTSFRTVALTTQANGATHDYQLIDLATRANPRPVGAPISSARFTTPNTARLAGAVTGSRTLCSWPAGQQFILALPPQTSAEDTGAAGLATSLALASHSSSLPLDPNIAGIATVSPSGELGGVPDLHARLRTAVAGGCKTVILSTASVSEITDSVILGATDLVRDLQIYAAPDLQSAFAIATAAPPYAHASSEFLLIQALTKSGKLAGRDAIVRLRAVAATTPGHVSAQLLVAAASGTLPEQLSIPTSSAKILGLAGHLLAPIDPKRGYPHPSQFDTEQLDNIRSLMTRHRPLLAPQTRRAADAANDLASLLSKFYHAPPRSGDGKRKMAITLKAATTTLRARLAELETLAGH